MANKTHDIAIRVGEYTKPDGTTGHRTRTIGRLMRADDGRPFILINAEALSTQLFALARKKGDDSIILSCFEIEQKEAAPSKQPERTGDDIPF